MHERHSDNINTVLKCQQVGYIEMLFTIFNNSKTSDNLLNVMLQLIKPTRMYQN